jgi:hypothetical protein
VLVLCQFADGFGYIDKGGFVVKTGQKAASTKFTEGIKEMYRDVKIGVK